MLLKRRFIFPLAVALLVSASSSRLPAQSSTPVLVIVGARVVDGSGNEPFPGTIVVRDGRIAEVGRNVRPPDGARTVDARGRIVTPGLIDVRVNLPAGATDDALARLFAAYLNAGVTSIGVANLDESKVDALRDHLSVARIKAPKLIAAAAPAGAMLASTLGSSLPDASALADWKKRNATFVPELQSAGQGDKKIALDRLRAAQQAGVRIAVGSNGGGSGASAPSGSGGGNVNAAVGGVTTLREIGLLVEGGLTPLQALTAATSGSAWALGLQSDRAFLAVGQRGDLVILSGEPTAGSGDAALIDQVFVGGEEVDRAALNSIITKPETPPPSPTTTAAPGAATAAGSTAAAASAKPAPPTSKAAARAGRKGRTRPDNATSTSAAEAAASESSASTPASPNATPSANATANTNTPAPAEPAPSSTAGAAPNPATTSPPTATPPAATSPAAPTPPATSPLAAAAAASAARAPATKAPAANSAAAAAAGGGSPAPIPVAEPMIDDFESGGDRTNLGATWNASNDAGSSADVIVGRVVRGLRDHALHLTARMGDTADPYVRITVALAHDGHPADVSQFHGLRFDARGQGRYRVVFVTRSVTDGRYHESFFSGSPLWTPVNIPFQTLGQTGAGTSVKWTGTDLLEIAFQIARDPGQMGWLELDNIRFY